MSLDVLEMHMPRKGSAAVLAPLQRRLAGPAAGEAQVQIEAAGVAYADIVMRQGLYKSRPLPVTPGYDLVGRVVALGEGVSGLSLGQRVAAVTVAGAYATHCNVDARWLVPAPEHADPAALVAAVLNGLTAWQMFHRIAHPAPNEWVLVHGAAGGVGSLLLDFARLAGVRAIGTASRGKQAVVSSRAAQTLDYAAGDVVEQVRALSGGGVVAAFDHLGGRHFKQVSMRSLRPGGVGVLYGGYDVTRDGRVNLLAMADVLLNSRFSAFRLFGQGQGVVGYSAPTWREARTGAYREDLGRVLQLVGEGQLRPLVGATYPLREAAAAQRALESRSVAGKIVLLPA